MLQKVAIILLSIALATTLLAEKIGKDDRLRDALSECVHYHRTLDPDQIKGLRSGPFAAVVDRCGKDAI